MFGWLKKHADNLFGRAGTWPRVRREFLARNPSCAACGGKNNLEALHIEPYRLAPEKELLEDNLIPLCGSPRNCHLMIGHGGDWMAYRPDVRRVAEFIRTSELRRD